MRFAVDTGGTFTDLIVEDNDGGLHMFKAATTPDDPIKGVLDSLDKAALEILYRIPGLGVRNAQRIVAIRRHTKVRIADLIKIRVSLKKCLPFIITADHQPANYELDPEKLRAIYAPQARQLELDFTAIQVPKKEVIGGEF